MKKILVILAIFSLILSLGPVVLAQAPEIPSGPPAGVEMGPSPDEIPEGGPGEISGPPAEVGPAISKPAVPGIPSQARDLIPDKDFVEVYCLMTKWKSGEFFAALDSIKDNLYPAILKVKEIGIEINILDLDKIKSEAEAKLNAICSAATVEAANAALDDFSSFGENIQSQLNNLNSDLDSKLRAKGDGLEAKIKTELQPFIDEEKAKIEAELRDYAQGLASEAQSDLESDVGSQTFDSPEAAQAYAQSKTGNLKSSIESKVRAKAEEKKKEIETKIQNKVEELIGPEKKKFEAIGDLFKDMGNKIQAGIESRKSQYEQYKNQAFAKRKALVFVLVDKNIADAKVELERNRAQFEEAKKSDPTIKTIEDIVAEMEADKAALGPKLDQAMESENEAAFEAAINDFRNKWENYRALTEKAFYNVKRICQIVREQFAPAKEKFSSGREQLLGFVQRCSGKSDDQCIKINELQSRFGTIINKMGYITGEMKNVEALCLKAEAEDRLDPEILALLEKIKKAGEDAQAYGEALEAEKAKAQVEALAKASDACKQILPQVKAAKIEMETETAAIKEKQAKCAGKTDAECQIINKLAVEVKSALGGLDKFLKDADKLEENCLKLKPNTPLEEIASLFSNFDYKKGDIDLMVKNLKYQLASLDNAAYACEAAQPMLESSAKVFSDSILKMRDKQKLCREKKGDPTVCERLKTMTTKIQDLELRYKNYSTLFYSIKRKCEEATRRSGGQAASGREMPASEVTDMIREIERLGEATRDASGAVERELAGLETETSWKNYIKSGQTFKVKFDAASFNDAGWLGSKDPMGTLKAGETYTIKYYAADSSWTAQGFNENTNAPGIWVYSTFRPDDFKLNLWGRVYTFNEKGEVYDRDYGLVGHLIK